MILDIFKYKGCLVIWDEEIGFTAHYIREKTHVSNEFKLPRPALEWIDEILEQHEK